MNIFSKFFTTKTNCLFLLVLLAIFLSGCASIAKGVASAILEKTESEDTRVCQVSGESFAGIDADLAKSKGKTKMLMVHGVGDHYPGYSTEFMEKLAKQLNLNVRSATQKNITLNAPILPGKSLGNLRVTHLLNEENGKNLTYYELTWSEITREEKALLTFDNSGEQNFRRAKVNNILKKFTNDTGPDPIIYLGQSREAILAAFAQSFCWMASGDWEDIPNSGIHTCSGLDDSNIDHIAYDDYVFVSHSLGSRITIDGMQRIAYMLSNPEKYLESIRFRQGISKEAFEALQNSDRKISVTKEAIQALQKKHLPIFMLSNQLPILQLGRELPEVAGQYANYCNPEGDQYSKRIFSKTSIVAFSDPNDLLSYAIPFGFSEKYLDSRLCTRITNVNINIAKVMDAFGISDMANPLEAHTGYDQDDRAIALIASGIGHEKTSPLIKQRCEFTKTVE